MTEQPGDLVKQRLADLAAESPAARTVVEDLGITPTASLPEDEDDNILDIPAAKPTTVYQAHPKTSISKDPDPLFDLLDPNKPAGSEPRSPEAETAIRANTIFYVNLSEVESLQEKLGIKDCRWISELVSRPDIANVPYLKSVLADMVKMRENGIKLPKDRISHLADLLYSKSDPINPTASEDMILYRDWKHRDDNAWKSVAHNAVTSIPDLLEDGERCKPDNSYLARGSGGGPAPIRINLLPPEPAKEPRFARVRQYLSDTLSDARDGVKEAGRGVASGIRFAALPSLAISAVAAGIIAVAYLALTTEKGSHTWETQNSTWEVPKSEIYRGGLKHIDSELRNRFGDDISEKLEHAGKINEPHDVIGSEGLDYLRDLIK